MSGSKSDFLCSVVCDSRLNLPSFCKAKSTASGRGHGTGLEPQQYPISLHSIINPGMPKMVLHQLLPKTGKVHGRFQAQSEDLLQVPIPARLTGQYLNPLSYMGPVTTPLTSDPP